MENEKIHKQYDDRKGECHPFNWRDAIKINGKVCVGKQDILCPIEEPCQNNGCRASCKQEKQGEADGKRAVSENG